MDVQITPSSGSQWLPFFLPVAHHIKPPITLPPPPRPLPFFKPASPPAVAPQQATHAAAGAGGCPACRCSADSAPAPSRCPGTRDAARAQCLCTRMGIAPGATSADVEFSCLGGVSCGAKSAESSAYISCGSQELFNQALGSCDAAARVTCPTRWSGS
jgi:hypothetical protein